MTVRTIEHKLARISREVARLNRDANTRIYTRRSFRIPTGDPSLRILDKMASARSKFCRLLERHPDRRIWIDGVYYEWIRPGEYRMVAGEYLCTA